MKHLLGFHSPSSFSDVIYLPFSFHQIYWYSIMMLQQKRRLLPTYLFTWSVCMAPTVCSLPHTSSGWCIFFYLVLFFLFSIVLFVYSFLLLCAVLFTPVHFVFSLFFHFPLFINICSSLLINFFIYFFVFFPSIIHFPTASLSLFFLFSFIFL